MRNVNALLVGLVVPLASFVFAAPASAAQVQIGKGVEARPTAPLRYVTPSADDSGASRILYRKADLASLPPNVPISAIEFDKLRSALPVDAGSFTVYLKNSSAAALAASPLSDAQAGATQVYTTANLQLPAESGWIKLDLATPFTYTGDGLEVITVWSGASGPRPEDVPWAAHPVSGGAAVLVGSGADELAPTATLDTGADLARPNLRVDYTPTAEWLVFEDELDGTAYASGATLAHGAFGQGVTITRGYRIANYGGAPVDLKNVTVGSATGVTALIAASIAGGALGPAANQSFSTTHFTPGATGPAGYTISITDNASATVASLRLEGTASTATKEVDVAIQDDDFLTRTPVVNGGSVWLEASPISQTRNVVVAVTNLGSSPLQLGATPVEILSAEGGTASILSQAFGPLNGQRVTTARLQLTFGNGTTDFTTVVRVNSDDPDDASYTTTIHVPLFDPAAPPTLPTDGDAGADGGLDDGGSSGGPIGTNDGGLDLDAGSSGGTPPPDDDGDCDCSTALGSGRSSAKLPFALSLVALASIFLARRRPRS